MATLTVSKEDEKRVKAMGFLSNKGTDNFSGRIVTRNGKITAKQQIAIGEAAEKFGNGNVTYTTRLTVEVQEFLMRKSRSSGLSSRRLGLILAEPVLRYALWYPVREQPVSMD